MTKALKKFEEACEVLMKETQDVNLTYSTKVRMAETVMGKLKKYKMLRKLVINGAHQS